MKFITLSNYRSGSSPFQRLLNSHLDITARQESLRSFGKTKHNLDYFLMNIFGREGPGIAKGFKVQYSQIPSGFWEFVEKQNVKVIHLIRKDLLETALWFRRNHIGDTTGGLGPPLIVRGNVTAKIDKTLDYVEWLRDKIKENRHRADFTVYYEDFTNNENVKHFYNDEVRKNLLEFLGVKDAPLEMPKHGNVKNTRGRSEDIVTNWDKLIKEMEKKGVERYYDE